MSTTAHTRGERATQTDETETAGRFVATFVERAGEVSVVFQRALRARFERHLSTVNGHRWYPTADVVAAFQTVAAEAGPATMRKGGMECATAVTYDESVTGVGAGDTPDGTRRDTPRIGRRLHVRPTW